MNLHKSLRLGQNAGLALDPTYYEYYTVHPAPGILPIVMDNIRCEEDEWHLAQCRHDGVRRHVNATCPRENVVGVRCVWSRGEWGTR